jgi:NTP pyrophosphatase (non-canonical NTP hydrolase)
MTEEISETQSSICQWAEETFGPITLLVSFDRFKEEFIEAEDFIKYGVRPTLTEHNNKIKDELADMLITLYRVAECAKVDLNSAVNDKMKINRNRKWKRYGDGTGQHE